MSLAKGIGAMKDAQKRIQASMQSSGGRYVGIGDQESFLFRFMIDEDGITNGYFHRVPMEQNDRSWTQDVPCLGDGCPYCASDDSKISKRSYKFLTWIWVYYRLHTKADEEGKWEPVEKDDGTFYKESLEKPMILKQGYYFSRLLTAIYAKYGTLIDRDYECIRNGTGLDTSYSLFPEDKRPMSKKVKAATKELEDIDGIIEGSNQNLTPASKPREKVGEEEGEEGYSEEPF
jgi:hypothetical protein